MADWYSNYLASVDAKASRQHSINTKKKETLSKFFDIIVDCLITSGTKSYIKQVFHTVQYELPCKSYHTSWESFKYKYVYESNFPPRIMLGSEIYYVENMNNYFCEYMKERYKLPFYCYLFRVNIGKLKRKEIY